MAGEDTPKVREDTVGCETQGPGGGTDIRDKTFFSLSFGLQVVRPELPAAFHKIFHAGFDLGTLLVCGNYPAVNLDVGMDQAGSGREHVVPVDVEIIHVRIIRSDSLDKIPRGQERVPEYLGRKVFYGNVMGFGDHAHTRVPVKWQEVGDNTGLSPEDPSFGYKLLRKERGGFFQGIGAEGAKDLSGPLHHFIQVGPGRQLIRNTQETRGLSGQRVKSDLQGQCIR